jgi:hypothetical protein
VEKSELDVLLGIEGQDWPKIKQVVVEVHDLEQRVKKITALLKEHGFRKITLEQEPFFEGSNVFSCMHCDRIPDSNPVVCRVNSSLKVMSVVFDGQQSASTAITARPPGAVPTRFG